MTPQRRSQQHKRTWWRTAVIILVVALLAMAADRLNEQTTVVWLSAWLRQKLKLDEGTSPSDTRAKTSASAVAPAPTVPASAFEPSLEPLQHAYTSFRRVNVSKAAPSGAAAAAYFAGIVRDRRPLLFPQSSAVRDWSLLQKDASGHDRLNAALLVDAAHRSAEKGQMHRVYRRTGSGVFWYQNVKREMGKVMRAAYFLEDLQSVSQKHNRYLRKQ